MSTWRIKVLIDGACPLCRREADLWRRLDRGRGRIVLEDVDSPDFDTTRYGLRHEQVMDQIHGVLPSGAVVRGLEVFRRAYAAVGCGWLLAPTAWPLLRPLFDRAYRWFARSRLRLTGRRGGCGRIAEGPMIRPELEPPVEVEARPVEVATARLDRACRSCDSARQGPRRARPTAQG